jgi:hypothetical protein
MERARSGDGIYRKSTPQEETIRDTSVRAGSSTHGTELLTNARRNSKKKIAFFTKVNFFVLYLGPVPDPLRV